jgi:hypothetical protein
MLVAIADSLSNGQQQTCADLVGKVHLPMKLEWELAV